MREARVADLEEVYRLRYARFVRVAAAITGDEDAAHDAVQDGFADALRHRRSYRGEGPLEAWVWRAVVNAARQARGKRGQPAPLEASEPSVNGTPSDETGVRAWLATLPERQRLAIFLRYYADRRSPRDRGRDGLGNAERRPYRASPSAEGEDSAVIHVEPLIRDELDRLVPAPTANRADWREVERRASRGRRCRALLAAVVALSIVAVAVSPLGAAISRTLGGFSDWLTGTPGEPAPESAQRMFEQANKWSGVPFLGQPRLHQLLRVDLDGRRFFLYGFETGQVVCLRIAVRALEGAGPQAACISRADLRRSGDLVLPVKANVSVGHVGPLPRAANDPPTVPKYLLTFGIAATEVSRVAVQSDAGTTAAAVGNGAFLHVLQSGRRGVWARTITATTRRGRTGVVPVSVQAAGQRPLATGLKPRGPATVERDVDGGTIGWFARREPRGIPARQAGLGRPFNCCPGFARAVYPDPNDFLAMVIGDETLVPRRPHAPFLPGSKDVIPRGKDVICFGALTRGGFGASCQRLEDLFREQPLALSWGFSGGGQQIWLVQGLASDDVARIEVFLGDGRKWQAPLRDNATVFRVQRAKFPARVVAYDAADRVIAVQTIRGG